MKTAEIHDLTFVSHIISSSAGLIRHEHLARTIKFLITRAKEPCLLSSAKFQIYRLNMGTLSISNSARERAMLVGSQKSTDKRGLSDISHSVLKTLKDKY